MEFGGGLATGIAIGMGSGIATGISNGRSQARQRIKTHIERNGLTIQDRFGKPVKLETFLEETCGCCGTKCSKATVWAIVLVGLSVLAAGLVAVYLMW